MFKEKFLTFNWSTEPYTSDLDWKDLPPRPVMETLKMERRARRPTMMVTGRRTRTRGSSSSESFFSSSG